LRRGIAIYFKAAGRQCRIGKVEPAVYSEEIDGGTRRAVKAIVATNFGSFR
jgi:hypothetical protein